MGYTKRGWHCNSPLHVFWSLRWSQLRSCFGIDWNMLKPPAAGICIIYNMYIYYIFIWLYLIIQYYAYYMSNTKTMKRFTALLLELLLCAPFALFSLGSRPNDPNVEPYVGTEWTTAQRSCSGVLFLTAQIGASLFHTTNMLNWRTLCWCLFEISQYIFPIQKC